MKKYMLLLMPLAISLSARTHAQDRTPLVMSRVDSILHADKKYSKFAEEVDKIPKVTKAVHVISFDSSDKKGNDITDNKGKAIPKDIYRYEVGDQKIDNDPAEILYYIYYSVNSNRILHISKKESWQRPY